MKSAYLTEAKICNKLRLDMLVRTSKLGETVRTRRKDRKLTQNDLSKLSGVSIGLISAIERGHGNPTMETLSKLGEALDLRLVLMLENPYDDQRLTA